MFCKLWIWSGTKVCTSCRFCMNVCLQNRLRHSQERFPTSLLYDQGPRALISARFCPWISVMISRLVQKPSRRWTCEAAQRNDRTCCSWFRGCSSTSPTLRSLGAPFSLTIWKPVLKLYRNNYQVQLTIFFKFGQCGSNLGGFLAKVRQLCVHWILHSLSK